MNAALHASGRLLLAIFLLGATHDSAEVGFVNLPQALAAHPLHAVLAGYNRGIAALRSTQAIAELGDPAAQAEAAAAALQRDAAAAQSRVARIASRNAGQPRAQERQALETVLATRNGADPEMTLYQIELARGTAANLTAYQQSISQRTDRAYAAREQQLRERELALAFRLARENAGTRLTLRLQLEELHLPAARRTQFEDELAALNAREADALAVMRRNNAATLAAYGSALAREGALAIAQMRVQLLAKAHSNLAVRRRVMASESSIAEMLPNLPSQLGAFAATYHVASDARQIVGGFQVASGDISRRFTALGETAGRSHQETAAQIEALERKRQALYQAMVAQISRDARRLAQQRHLERVEVSSSRPRGSVDLTAAVRDDLARF